MVKQTDLLVLAAEKRQLESERALQAESLYRACTARCMATTGMACTASCMATTAKTYQWSLHNLVGEGRSLQLCGFRARGAALQDCCRRDMHRARLSYSTLNAAQGRLAGWAPAACQATQRRGGFFGRHVQSQWLLQAVTPSQLRPSPLKQETSGETIHCRE